MKYYFPLHFNLLKTIKHSSELFKFQFICASAKCIFPPPPLCTLRRGMAKKKTVSGKFSVETWAGHVRRRGTLHHTLQLALA